MLGQHVVEILVNRFEYLPHLILFIVWQDTCLHKMHDRLLCLLLFIELLKVINCFETHGPVIVFHLARLLLLELREPVVIQNLSCRRPPLLSSPQEVLYQLPGKRR